MSKMIWPSGVVKTLTHTLSRSSRGSAKTGLKIVLKSNEYAGGSVMAWKSAFAGLLSFLRYK